MSAVLQEYEQQYYDLANRLRSNVASIPSLQGAESKSHVIAESSSEIKEAESLIRMMDLEARNLPASEGQAFLRKFKDFKAELDKIKKDMKKAEASSRDELFGLDDSSSSVQHRQKLLGTTDRLQNSSRLIEQGKRTAAETEDLGVSILQDLHRQREKITNARDTLDSADDNVSRSRKILSSMARRMVTNKLLLWGVILVLVLIIVIVIWAKVH